VRVAELLDGPPMRPTKKESSIANQELAARLMGRFVPHAAELMDLARETEALLVAEAAAAGAVASGPAPNVPPASVSFAPPGALQTPSIDPDAPVQPFTLPGMGAGETPKFFF